VRAQPSSEQGKRTAPIMSTGHIVAFLFQHIGHQIDYCDLIIDDQNVHKGAVTKRFEVALQETRQQLRESALDKQIRLVYNTRHLLTHCTAREEREQLMERPAMVATGVPQLDTILGGGIVERSLLLLCGPPGSGKTVLASQIMSAAVDRGERVLLVTIFSEPQAKLITHLRSLRFFRPETLGASIKLLNLQHQLLTNLDTVADTLVREAHEHGASLVMLDGLNGVLLGSVEPLAPYRFLYNISAKLGMLGSSTIMTLALAPGAELEHPELTAADTIVALSQEHVAVTGRVLRVIKHRGAKPLLGEHRFRIDGDGVRCFARLESLAQPGNVEVADARAAFGLPELDAAMNGGPNHATSTLLRGAGGAAKSLGLRWLLDGLAAQQRAAFVSLREPERRQLHSSTAETVLQQAASEGRLLLRSYHGSELLPDQLAHELLDELSGTTRWRVLIDGVGELTPLLAAEGRGRRFWAALLAELRIRNATTLLLDDRLQAAAELATLTDNRLHIRRRQASIYCSVHDMRFSRFDRQPVALTAPG